MPGNQDQEQDYALEQLITDGIAFLTSLTKYYGNEKGMEVWDAMGDAVGREIRGKVLFAMLSGTHVHELGFVAGTAEHNGNAVPVIKCIRNYTGYGLKEAKDHWDQSKTSRTLIKISNSKQLPEFRRELRSLGCTVF